GAFVGGHVNNVVNLSKKLAEDGYQVHIVTTPPIHHDSSFRNSEMSEINSNVFFHQVNVRGDFINATLNYGIRSITKILLEIRKLHRIEKFDVIHGHSGFSLISLIPKIGGIFSGVPSIHTLYSPLDEKVVSRKISKYCLRGLDLITVLSENTKKSLQNIVPENKIKVIPPLIDTSRYNPQITDSSAREESDEKNHTLLFIGNLTKSKGIEILIKALKIVKVDFPDIKLLMGIDIPLKEFLNKDFTIKRQIKELGLDQNVIPLGIIKDLPEVIARSDIFVAPFTSTYGPADYPLSVLEAMASGLPVVASNVGGIPEIAKHGENGLLVEPNDPSELANAINCLIGNKEEAKKMGNNGAAFTHSLNEIAISNYLNLYQQIIEEC
ncbi:MAG: glycosyltransferase family 4 protein, partial [Thermoplasmatales archaeon]|nr:glycosyltransferase family 4 protein [Thermoplasmatales archaeon]